MTDLQTKLTQLARSRMLYWKHRKTGMIAKSIGTINLMGEETLMVRVDKEPTINEPVSRARMEKSFVLITADAYQQIFDRCPPATGPNCVVDLEAGKVTPKTA